MVYCTFLFRHFLFFLLSRPLSYPDTDVLLVCFSLENPDSFENITQKWIPEIRHYCPNVPFILVATKKDLRHNEFISDPVTKKKYKHVTTEEGQQLAEHVKAFAYVECSAKTRDGVREVFDTAAKAALQKRKALTHRKCKLL